MKRIIPVILLGTAAANGQKPEADLAPPHKREATAQHESSASISAEVNGKIMTLLKPGMLGFAFQTKERQSAEAEREYERGMRSLDKRQWDEAVQHFQEVAAAGKERADGALYWKAYALGKLGRGAEAGTTLDELTKKYAQSRWLNDAKALRVEIAQAAGKPLSPEDTSDDELKLMAINSLMNSDPERSVPLLEKLLETKSSPKLRERALFVLSQSNNAKARETVAKVARGGMNPDLQMRAIHYLGIHGGKENRQLLADVYGASTDVAVKKQILHSFMISGERDRLLTLAKSESNVELRKAAIHWLGTMGAQSQLKEMYGAEQSSEVRAQILEALFVGNDVNTLIEVAKSDKDPELRRKAINYLGNRRSSVSGEALSAIYAANTDVETRQRVLRALFVQGNAPAIVEIARAEKDPELRKSAVGHLSRMKSKEATDFLMEILNK